MADALRLVLFGPPGAGKGTQAQLLKERLGVAHISSGDLFRRHLDEQTPLGLKAAEFVNQGLLVPDEMTIDIILNMVLSLNSEDGFILDGFPRSHNQAEALEQALAQRSRGLDKVVHIDVPEPELVRRLGGRYSCRDCQTPYTLEPSNSHNQGDATSEEAKRCTKCGGELYQRADDSPEAVQRRIEVYRNETTPLLDYYRKRGLLADVPGSGSVETVNNCVTKVLRPE